MMVLKVDGKEITLTKDQALAYNEPGLRDVLVAIRLAERGKAVTFSGGLPRVTAGKSPETKVTVAFISEETGGSPSTVRDRLRRLGLHGLAVRKADKTYELTDAGRELADAVLEQEKASKSEKVKSHE